MSLNVQAGHALRVATVQRKRCSLDVAARYSNAAAESVSCAFQRIQPSVYVHFTGGNLFDLEGAAANQLLGLSRSGEREGGRGHRAAVVRSVYIMSGVGSGCGC